MAIEFARLVIVIGVSSARGGSRTDAPPEGAAERPSFVNASIPLTRRLVFGTVTRYAPGVTSQRADVTWTNPKDAPPVSGADVSTRLRSWCGQAPDPMTWRGAVVQLDSEGSSAVWFNPRYAAAAPIVRASPRSPDRYLSLLLGGGASLVYPDPYPFSSG